MKLTYIISALKGLKKREFNKFLSFLSSTYFNSKTSYITLAEYLYKNIQMQVYIAYDKQHIYNILYPDVVFNDLKLRHAISYFKKLLEEFLILNHYKTNIALKHKTLLHVLRKKNLKYNFQQTLNKISPAYQAPNNIATFYSSIEKYFLLKEEYEFDHQHRRTTVDNLKPMVSSLEYFYLLENIRLACLDWVYIKSSGNKSYFQSKIDHLLLNIPETEMSQHHTLNLYYHLYILLYKKDTNKKYKVTSEYLHRIQQELSIEDKKTTYLLLINYCIQKSNQGNLEFTKAALELYYEGIQNKILLENGVLSPFTYKNIINLLLSLEQFEETKSFLENFKKFLPSDISQNSYQYNLALLYFKQQDFDNAMKVMANTNFIDEYDDLSARRMLIRIYFEKKEWISLHSLLDSFEIYIKRKKNLGYHKESYMLLIQFTRKILLARLKDPKKLSKIYEDLMVSPNFPEKKWLVETIKNYKSKTISN